ncbi:hypothetical protein HY256_12765, partial [Candidatus Sumerlaeota bacterium]|nr:hypothetical protein [Candidatus Sumerlaeota bacterium]
HPKFHDTPIFILSGEKHPDLPSIAQEVGGNLFLPKPIDPVKLIKLIEYFVKEMNLTPRAAGASPAARREEAPAAAVSPSGTLRILTIDSNLDNVAILKDALAYASDLGWETLWSEEPRVALGHLQRWEPEMILYNPRQKVMEGAAFVQFLEFKKMTAQFEIAFIGKDFTDADSDYSLRHLNRRVIRLNQEPEALLNELRTVAQVAAKKIKLKKHTLEEIRQQDRDLEVKIKADTAQLREEREKLRKQYQRMQGYIDKEYK